MKETLTQVKGVLLSDPFPYQSVEVGDEVYLAKFQPSAPLQVGTLELHELHLNLGFDARGLRGGDEVSVTGVLEEKQLVTRSGKIRRGVTYQVTVGVVER